MALQATVSIPVTIKGGTVSAPTVDAHYGEEVTWTIGGTIGGDDLVAIGNFRGNQRDHGSPISGNLQRQGPGPITGRVTPGAPTDTYKYDVMVTPAGGGPPVNYDPQIQIKP